MLHFRVLPHQCVVLAKRAALGQYAKNELERAALLHYSNSYAYAGRVYCICVVVFGCEDCEDF